MLFFWEAPVRGQITFVRFALYELPRPWAQLWDLTCVQLLIFVLHGEKVFAEFGIYPIRLTLPA